jgi:phage terminase large subunit-like protein
MLDAYIRDVTTNQVVVSRWVSLAVQRFLAMRERFPWSAPHVAKVCGFVESLPHVEGSWATPTIRLEPWQVFCLAAIYGFRQPDGRRLVSSAFIEVGRKSAKSTLCAALGLFHLLHEHEPGAQVVCGATTGDQSRVVFGIMQRMVRRSLALREAGLVAYANSITYDPQGATAKPLNAKSSTQDGLNPSMIVLDESHAQDFGLHDVLKSAQGARRDPLLLAPTTAGYDLTSVGAALHDTAKQMLEGLFDLPHVFAVIYALDDLDDWADDRVWVKALPMIGTTPTREYVEKYRDDVRATPGLQGEFEVKICNRWAHATTTWLSIAEWTRCADPTLRLEQFLGQPCWIGVDLAQRDDIAAVAFVFPGDDDVVTVFVRGYLPADVVTARARAVPAYREWVAAGELVLTPGNFIDHARIEADLRADCRRFAVQAIVLEQFSAAQMTGALFNDGYPATAHRKSASTFTAPASEFAARITAGRLRHPGTLFLTWQVSNACVEQRRDGTLLPTKGAAKSPRKIDAVDAICLALAGYLTRPAPVDYAIHLI